MAKIREEDEEAVLTNFAFKANSMAVNRVAVRLDVKERMSIDDS